MQLAAKIGVGIGIAAAAAGTATWAKVVYDDAAHDRNNNRNSVANLALWGGAVVAGVAGIVARRVAPPAAPWLFASAALLGVNALASAATAEQGWADAGISYCAIGVCNRTAVDKHGAPSIYFGPNPLDGITSTPSDHVSTK
jgi:hypothetical protein